MPMCSASFKSAAYCSGAMSLSLSAPNLAIRDLTAALCPSTESFASTARWQRFLSFGTLHEFLQDINQSVKSADKLDYCFIFLPHGDHFLSIDCGYFHLPIKKRTPPYVLVTDFYIKSLSCT